MKAERNRFLPIVVAVLAMVLPFAAAPSETALDRYVHAPDPSYKFEVVGTLSAEGTTATVLDLTSQTWKSPIEANRTVASTVVTPFMMLLSLG